jgi:hypothetical protein
MSTETAARNHAYSALVSAWPRLMVSYAGLTVEPSTRMLFITGWAPIALSADQALVLYLLVGRRGRSVEVARLEQNTVNAAATTVDSLNGLLQGVSRLAVIVRDGDGDGDAAGRGYRLVDASADASLGFADLCLNREMRLLLVPGQLPVVMSPQSTAVLALLIQAQGELVTSAEVQQVSGKTAAGVAVGNLTRRLRTARTAVTIVNDRARGWRLIGPV